MAMTEAEELELLELEEQEYQHQKAKATAESNPDSELEKTYGDYAPFIKTMNAVKTGLATVPAMELTGELAGGLEAAGQAVGLKNLGSNSVLDTEFAKPVWDLNKLGEAYKSAKANRQAYEDKTFKDEPIGYGIGGAAGLVASGPLALGGKVAGWLGKALPAVEGGVMGGVSAFGESPNTIADNPMGLATDTVKGALAGTVLGAGAGKVVEKLGDAKTMLEKMSRLRALKAFGIKEKDLKGMSESDIHELGETILSKDFLTMFGGQGDALGKMKSHIDGKEQVLNETLDLMKSAGVQPQDKKELGKQIVEAFKNKYKGAPDSEIQGSINKINDWVGMPKVDIPNPNAVELPQGMMPPPAEPWNPVLSIDDLQNKKVTLNKFIKDAGFTNQNPGQTLDAYLDIRKGMRGALEDQSNKAADASTALFPTEALNLKGTNQDLGKLYKLQDVAERQNLKDMMNMPGLNNTDKLSILASAVSGNPKAMIAGGVMKAGKAYGDKAVALATKNAAEMAGTAAPKIAAGARVTERLVGGQLGKDSQSTGTVTGLASKSPEELQMFAERALASGDKIGEEIGTALNQVAGKPEIQRTATLFKLMQQEKYRVRLNQLKDEE